MKEKSRTSQNFFEDLQPEYEALVNLSVEISGRIEDILTSKGISQKQFAELMGKSESEISKWLSGMHNFTIKSIVRIEAVLEEKVIHVAGRSEAGAVKRKQIFQKGKSPQTVLKSGNKIVVPKSRLDKKIKRRALTASIR